MKPSMIRAALLSAIVGSSAIAMERSPATQPAQARKSVEVCFVLDTTGSMGGLIDGAKRKIWSIANSIIAANHGGSVKIALVPYRDRGDEYVTKIFDLTDDVDRVFADLQSFTANGGGDEPESVNQALSEAVGKVHWSKGDDVARIIFLVGDAPPHMDYQDDVKFPQTCELAAKNGLIINTVQCGATPSTHEIWEKIARLSEGSYVALEQSGGMVAIATPMDKDIADLSNQIGALAMPYGDAKQQAEVNTKNALACSQPAAVAADRAMYNAAAGKAIQGQGDLVSDLRENRVKLEDVRPDQLPKELQNLPREEQLAKIKQQSEQRDQLSARVTELSRQRQTFIDAEMKRLSGRADAFDAKVREVVEKELQTK